MKKNKKRYEGRWAKTPAYCTLKKGVRRGSEGCLLGRGLQGVCGAIDVCGCEGVGGESEGIGLLMRSKCGANAFRGAGGVRLVGALSIG
eukprot:494221-Pyramimonas_sp.AAC.2